MPHTTDKLMDINDVFGEEKKVDSAGLQPASLGFAPIALPIELRAQLEMPVVYEPPSFFLQTDKMIT